jgi:hypothetical protein
LAASFIIGGKADIVRPGRYVRSVDALSFGLLRRRSVVDLCNDHFWSRHPHSPILRWTFYLDRVGAYGAAFDVLPLCGRLPSHVANVLQLGGRRDSKGVDQFVDSRQAILPIGKWAE